MASSESPTPSEFIEFFRYKHWLLRHDPYIMGSFDRYVAGVGALRSAYIYMLRSYNMPGRERAWYNNLIHKYCYTRYSHYLYFLDDSCQLCGFVIGTIKEVTEDHILPTALGGENRMANKQIAHGHCNVLKSNKPIRTFNKAYVLK